MNTMYRLVFLMTCVLSGALPGAAGALQPKTYVSPSGDVAVRVDPGVRSGAGPAAYEVHRNGDPVWSGRRPFTLWDAAVGDDGTVIGYAYSDGFQGLFDTGDFVVAILDPQGAIRLLQKTPREPSRFLHVKADPKGLGVFLDADDDRFVVRVEDPDVNAGSESWWIYRLSDGNAIGTVKPRALMANATDIDFALDARAVPGTPLTIVQWLRSEYREQEGISALGVRFSLVDLDYKPVWKLDLAEDYTIRDDRQAQALLMDEIRQRGAILDASQRNRFEVRHVADGARVTYAVESDANQPKGWKIRVVESKPYVNAAGVKRETLSSGSLLRDPTSLHVGSIKLGNGPVHRREQPIRNIGEFAITDAGLFGILRHCGCTDGEATALVVVNADGTLVREVALPAKRDVERHIAWLEGNDWLVTTSTMGEDAGSSAMRINIGSGAMEPLSAFTAPGIDALVPSIDGGFVALADSSVLAFDRAGKLLWQINSDYDDEAALFSPEDITVARSGDLVVLENIRNQLKIYDRNGRHQRTIELAKVLGREPNYPAGVTADRNGGFVIHDFNGKPPLLRLTSDWKVAASFRPVLANNHGFHPTNQQVGPDGRLWTSDGHSLVRLDDHGVVDRILGRPYDPGNLDQVAALSVTRTGWIYAADNRTGAVHVFDPNGARHHVCVPEPTDYNGSLGLPSLTVSDTGDVFIERGNGLAGPMAIDFIHYTPTGKRAGIESIKLEEVSQTWYSQPGTDNFWVLGYDRAYLTDRRGTILRRIERMGNGQWISNPGPAAVAPDGAIAMVSGDGWRMPMGGEVNVPPVISLFSASGDALATWPAPEQLMEWGGNIAFDGDRLAFLLSSDLRGSEISVLVTDTKGVPQLMFKPPVAHFNTRLFFVGRNGTTELWLFDGDSTIDRFAIP